MKEREVFGVTDEGAKGLVGVSFVEDGIREEEAASGGAGAFAVYLWTGGTLLGKLKLSG